MAWIESHQALGRHPKLIRLASVLRIHKAQAIGHLQYLWWWALDFAPTGDLSAFTPAEITAGAEWPGEPGPFHKALRACGWIDDDGSIHDWSEYGGKLVDQRSRDRNRKRIPRSSDGTPAEGVGTSAADNTTGEDIRQQEKREPTAGAGAGVDEPDWMDDPRFKAAWAEWEKHRVEIRHKLTPTTQTKQRRDLERMGLERSIVAIDHSISKGWQGLFEPEERRKNGIAGNKPTAAERGEAPEDIRPRMLNQVAGARHG